MNTNTPAAKGTPRKCSRCQGTGSAGYNHANGDTYCYLCDGTGFRMVLSAAEKAQEAADSEWYATHAQACYSYKTNREVRNSPYRKNLTLFVNMALGYDG